VVFSPANRRFSLAVIAMVVMGLGVVGAVVVLEILAARPGHVDNGCGSISRVLGFGGTVMGMIGMQLRIEYLAKRHEQRTVGRQQQLRTDVRHDVRGELTPVKLAATAAVDKVMEIERATNGNLAEAVRVAAEQARAAEREQIVSDPKFWSAIDANLRRMVKEICAERDKDK
jgi:hypothetical protein